MGINRGTVLDLINDVHRVGGFKDYNSYSYLFNQVDTMPESKEDAEPHWIPVTEDTPKEAGTYMCTCYDAGRRIVTLVKWQPRTKTWNLTGARAYWKVIAWCKRPEPYKGVTE